MCGRGFRVSKNSSDYYYVIVVVCVFANLSAELEASAGVKYFPIIYLLFSVFCFLVFGKKHFVYNQELIFVT